MKHLMLTCALLIFCIGAYATTIPYKNFNQLVNESDAIVQGNVGNISSQYSPDNEIFTFVTLNNINILKGKYSKKELTVRLKGGEIENDVLHIDGAPNFNLGEQVIVFLHGNGHEIVPFTGWTQGVFRIKQNSKGGNEVLDHDGNRVFSVSGSNLVKEKKFFSESHFLGDQSLSVAAAQAKASPGNTDDGSVVMAEQTEKMGVRPKTGLSLQSFVSIINSKLQNLKATASRAPNLGQEIKSIIDFPGTTEGQDEANPETANSASQSINQPQNSMKPSSTPLQLPVGGPGK